MATMAAFKSNTANGYALILRFFSTQEPEKNRSKIRWEFELQYYGLQKNIIQPGEKCDINLTIGGKQLMDSSSYTITDIPSQDWANINLGDGTFYLDHNRDGNLGITLAANFKSIVQDKIWAVPPLKIVDTYQMPRMPQKPPAPGIPVILDESPHRFVTIQISTPYSPWPVEEYQMCLRDNHRNEDWVIYQGSSFAIKSFRPERPVTAIELRGRVKNAAGWGEWSGILSFTSMGLGPYITVGGVPKYTHSYVKHKGVWIPAIPTVREEKLWKPIGPTD